MVRAKLSPMTLRRTVAHPVTATGTALHAGVRVSMTLSPAASGSGIVFRRADLGVDIPARYDLVSETRLGTVIGKGGAKVGVVEHLMAAAAGAEIDDLLVTLDGPEPPILDGDALSYLSLLESAGVSGTGRAAHGHQGVESRNGGKRRCHGLADAGRRSCLMPMSSAFR